MLFLLVLLLPVNFYACADMEGYLENRVPLIYTVSLEFSDISDDSIIEERAKLCMFNIESKQIEGNKITYVFESVNPAGKRFFELLCTNDVVTVENEAGEIVFTKENVLSIEHDRKHLYLKVGDDLYKAFETKEYGSCYFVDDDIKVPSFGKTSITESTGDKMIVFMTWCSSYRTLSEESEAFLKGIFNLMPNSFNGEVTVKSVSFDYKKE